MRLSKVGLALVGLSFLSPRSFGERPAPEVPLTTLPGHASTRPTSAETATRGPAGFGALPTRFEENRGQAVEGVRYVVKSRGLGAALTDEGLTLALPGNDRGELLRLRVVGGRAVTPRAEQRQATRSSYFFGQDPNRWVRDAPSFGRVVYPSVREGVDLVFHGEDGQLEYDFVLGPRASVQSLEVEVSGAQSLSLTEDGSLAITTPGGTFVQRRPRVFQRGVEGRPVDVGARYVLREGGRFAFEMSAYDAERELVIDPVLEFSTYLGGSGNDRATAVAADTTGIYVSGLGLSGYPLRHEIGGSTGAGFVAKLDPSGALLYTASVAGVGTVRGIAVDPGGGAVFAGTTEADDLPVVSAFQSTRAGLEDGYLVKLMPDGNALQFSTYFGGEAGDRVYALTADATGHVFVGGRTESFLFPTLNAAQSTLRSWDGFVAKFGSDGTLDYSTYLGAFAGDSEVRAIAVDGLGRAHVVGWTLSDSFPPVQPFPFAPTFSVGFYAELSSDGRSLLRSSFLDSVEGLSAVAVDAAGSVYVAGKGSGPLGLATKTFGDVALGQSFVMKLTGATVDYCDVFGADLAGVKLSVDARGSAIVVGRVSGPMPTSNAFQPASGGGSDAFVFKLSPDGQTFELASYLGGTGNESASALALDARGTAYVVGETALGGFPTVRPAQPIPGGGTDAFVAKVVPPPYLSPTRDVVPRGSLTVAASSGSGTGYVYSFAKNLSGGTLDAATGAYVAGARPSAVDEVVVTDSNGNTAVTSITVGPGVGVVPASPTLLPRTKLTFRGAGGSGEGYVFAMSKNGSGATFDAASATYTAGDVSFAVDTLTVVDSLGNTGSTSITVSRLGSDEGDAVGDAGVGDGGADGGVQDAGVEAGTADGDAGEPNGGMSGGGCDCRTGTGRGGGGLAAGVMVVVVGLVVGRRRRG